MKFVFIGFVQLKTQKIYRNIVNYSVRENEREKKEH